MYTQPPAYIYFLNSVSDWVEGECIKWEGKNGYYTGWVKNVLVTIHKNYYGHWISNFDDKHIDHLESPYHELRASTLAELKAKIENDFNNNPEPLQSINTKKDKRENKVVIIEDNELTLKVKRDYIIATIFKRIEEGYRRIIATDRGEDIAFSFYENMEWYAMEGCYANLSASSIQARRAYRICEELRKIQSFLIENELLKS